MIRKAVYILGFLMTGMATAQIADRHEQVYLHLSESSVLCGETLYYSAYVRSEATGRQSSLSKYLYVEMLGNEGVVFWQKLSLENGRGHGHFFIPSTVATARYKLVAYTRWMKNFDEYFEVPVVVINPYEKYEMPEVDAQLSVRFLVQNEGLVRSIPNEVGFILGGESYDQLIDIARVVDQNGEPVASFELTGDKIGKFQITPGASHESLRLILEDTKGNFSYHPLPKIVDEGVALLVDFSENEIKISLNAEPAVSGDVQINVKDLQNTRYHWSFAAAEIFRIPKRTLEAGIWTFEVMMADDVIAQKEIFVAPPSPKVDTLKGTYGKRSLAKVPVNLPEGDYSASVKLVSLDFKNHLPAVFTDLGNQRSLTNLYQKDMPEQQMNLVLQDMRHRNISRSMIANLLPEFDDELISGKLLMDSGEVGDQTISLSFAGENFQIQSAGVDDNGDFTISYKNPGKDALAHIGLYNSNQEYELVLEDKFVGSKLPLKFEPLILDSATIMQVAERSIRNQIENAYYIHKLDQSDTSANWQPMFEYDQTYVLDEYTRFGSLQETFVEFIPQVSMRPKRTPVFSTINEYIRPDFDLPALVLLDGVPVDHRVMIDVDPYKIRQIDVITSRVYVSNIVADGLISFSSFEGDFAGVDMTDVNSLNQIIGVLPDYTYFKADHSEETSLRIPDQRDLILWEPHLRNHDEVTFYTSDVSGLYSLKVEGYTAEGRPISLTKLIRVD